METLTDCPGPPLTLADIVPVLNAPGWISQWLLLISHLCDVSVGDSEDGDLIPLQSGEDWIAQLDDDLSRPASQSGEVFSITALQMEDPTCVTLLEWIRSDTFPPWTEVKSLCPELRFLWHHRNNLSADTNGVLWRKCRSPEESDYS